MMVMHRLTLVLVLFALSCASVDRAEENTQQGDAPLSADDRAWQLPEADRERLVQGPVEDPVRTWSRERLAHALAATTMDRRGVVSVAGKPNWAAADALLASTRSEHAVDVVATSGRGEVKPADLAQAADKAIIGGDGRTLANVTLRPNNAIARLSITFSDGSGGACSGAYIGPWTMLTAAHCLVDGTAVANRVTFQPQRAGSRIPYSYACRNDDTNRSNDFFWAVPTGYTTGARSFDYAVIDTYPCHNAPAWFEGYVVWPNDDTYSVHGYPGERCPGASADGTFQCGMSGPAYDTDGWILETEHIDTQGGQSGAPWYKRYDLAYRVAAVHSGYREYFDLGRCGFDNCRRNLGRLIDDGVDAFIRENAFDF